MNALEIAVEVLQALPQLITAGVQVESLIANTVTVIQSAQSQNRDPTSAEWDALDAVLSNLRAKLDA